MLNKENQCELCGKYSNGATLCNACQKKALKKNKKPKTKGGLRPISETLNKLMANVVSGTPPTLLAAVTNGRLDHHHNCVDMFCGGECCDAFDHVESIHKHVRDFLAQKFGAARMEATEETDAALVKLFNKITGEQIT